MSIGGRIDDDAGGLFQARFLDEGDELALDVRLAEHHVEAEALGGVTAQALDIGQSRRAVFLRLAQAQHIEVGSVEDIDRLGHCSRSSGRAGVQSFQRNRAAFYR